MAANSGGMATLPARPFNPALLNAMMFRSVIDFCKKHKMREPGWFDKDFSGLDDAVPTPREQEEARLAFEAREGKWPAGITCPLKLNDEDLEN